MQDEVRTTTANWLMTKCNYCSNEKKALFGDHLPSELEQVDGGSSVASENDGERKMERQ